MRENPKSKRLSFILKTELIISALDQRSESLLKQKQEVFVIRDKSMYLVVTTRQKERKVKNMDC